MAIPYESNLLAGDMEKYFGFLISEYGFTKIPEYGYVREILNDYIKNDIIVKVTYEGSYSVDIGKARAPGLDLLNGKKRSMDYEIGFFNYYNLLLLDPVKGIYKTVVSESDQGHDLTLKYFSAIIKLNTEILDGDFRKFSLRYRFLKKLHLIK
ncbi:MAG: hypothetical protein WCL00_08390 [Bacteroidota bacterium]